MSAALHFQDEVHLAKIQELEKHGLKRCFSTLQKQNLNWHKAQHVFIIICSKNIRKNVRFGKCCTSFCMPQRQYGRGMKNILKKVKLTLLFRYNDTIVSK